MKFFCSLFLLLTSLLAIGQSRSNDCSGAIQICGDGIISTSADGIGIQEVSDKNSCGSMEHNSLWLYIEITKPGTLGFTLKPTSSDIQIDYDFFIFGPNANCGNLGQAIRCSTTNPNAAGSISNLTGMNDSETDTGEGPGQDGNNFVRSLDVQPGETYFIVIDRPIGNSPFELEWTGTATIGGTPFPEGPQISQPQDLQTCNALGMADFDLDQQRPQINNQNNTTITFHESLGDATDNFGALGSTYTSTNWNQTIFARVENDLTGCAKITDFQLIINPGPEIDLDANMETCDLDYSGSEIFQFSEIENEILASLDANDFNITYHLSEEDAINNLNAIASDYDSAGDETIYARVSDRDNVNCFNISSIQLTLNIPPELTDYSLVQPEVNSGTNTVTLNFPEDRDYEYSLGNSEGPYQESTLFKNVPAGIQTLYIRDKKGCAVINTKIAILGYPLFFTPNGDGYNDFWQIKGLNATQNTVNLIRIFDRYGKLLKEMPAASRGWDGSYNGNALPSDDYWFEANLESGIQFKGHFSLIR